MASDGVGEKDQVIFERALTFDTILKSLEKQKGTYHTSKRITGTVKDYLIEANSGAPAAKIGDDWDFELVLDGTGKQRRTVTSSRLKPAERLGTGVYATPDIYYIVKRDGDRYYIDNFFVRNSSLMEFARVLVRWVA